MKKTTLVLAAIIAVGLASGASAAYIVHTRDIANGAVTHAKLAKKSVGSNNLRAGSVGSGNLASATQDRLPQWFLINSSGAIVSQSGGVTQSPGGEYKLAGATNLDYCAIEANAIGGGTIDAAPSPSGANELEVKLPTGAGVPPAYSIIVLCPKS